MSPQAHPLDCRCPEHDPRADAHPGEVGARSPVLQAPADGDHVWIGLILDGKYRILSFIDEGGAAEVYQAERLSTGKRVAVKLIDAAGGPTDEVTKRFFQEVRLASLIAHPNVVTIEDFGTAPPGLHYLVMELLEGRSLASALRAGPLASLVALRYAMSLCEGLAAAHERGVIHCDLKPANVFLQDLPERAAPQVKLLDLGIGRLLKASGAALSGVHDFVAGTPDYMSPEQCQGRPLGPASDVYSLGVILYEMLLGTTPFVASSWVEVLGMHVHKQPVWQRARAELLGIPREAEGLVLRMLSKDPPARPASMLDVQRELGLIARSIRAAGHLGRGLSPLSDTARGPSAPASPQAEACSCSLEADGMRARIAELERVVAEYEANARRDAVFETMRRSLRAAHSLLDETGSILNILCALTGTDAGALWLVDGAQQRMHCECLAHREGAPVREFLEKTLSLSFPRCRGLPGRIWASGEPAVISDLDRDSNFVRAEEARCAGLRSGFGVPVCSDGEVVGVLELYSRADRAPNAALMTMLVRLGDEMGALFGRQKARAELAAVRLGRTSR